VACSFGVITLLKVIGADMIFTWASLGCLIVGLLLLWRKGSIWLPGIFILSGVVFLTYSENISLFALGVLLFFDILVYLEHRPCPPILLKVFPWVIGGIAFGLCAHLIPGFNNYLWLSQLKLSDLSAPFNLYLNFDKTIAGCIMVWVCFTVTIRPLQIYFNKRSVR
jgi:hypothetical protein